MGINYSDTPRLQAAEIWALFGSEAPRSGQSPWQKLWGLKLKITWTWVRYSRTATTGNKGYWADLLSQNKIQVGLGRVLGLMLGGLGFRELLLRHHPNLASCRHQTVTKTTETLCCPTIETSISNGCTLNPKT